jgi:hypothetical protein
VTGGTRPSISIMCKNTLVVKAQTIIHPHDPQQQPRCAMHGIMYSMPRRVPVPRPGCHIRSSSAEAWSVTS